MSARTCPVMSSYSRGFRWYLSHITLSATCTSSLWAKLVHHMSRCVLFMSHVITLQRLSTFHLQNERLSVSKQKVSAKCFYSAYDKLVGFFCLSTVKFHFYLQRKKKARHACNTTLQNRILLTLNLTPGSEELC